MTHSPTCSGCPTCDPHMAAILRMDSEQLSALNTARTQQLRGAQGGNFRTTEAVDERAARLAGFFRASKPRAASVETDPKAAPKAPCMVAAVQRQAATNSVRDIAGVPQRYPVRLPAAEPWIKPIAVDGEVVDPNAPAPKMPSMLDAINASRK